MTTVETGRRGRYLFVLWDGGGNVVPQVALMRALAARGHDVLALAPRVLAARIEAAGAKYLPYTAVPEHDSASPEGDLIRDWSARTPLGAAACARDNVMAGTAQAFAADVLAALEQSPADVVASDYMLLGAYLAAECASLPLAVLIHHIYPLPAQGLPPFGLGLAPARNRQERLRDALLKPLFRRFYDGALPTLNRARHRLGLRPVASLFDLFARPERALVLTSKAFDFAATEWPANVRYVGAQFDSGEAGDAGAAPWRVHDTRPLVAVSLSTTFQRQGDLLQRLIHTLGELPVRAVVTAGPALAAHRFETPDNVTVRAYVPHEELFPRAALVVTHGGHGTVMRALSYGVPVLCLPMGRDQGDIAARVVWHGAGARLPGTADSARIRTRIQEMLAESRYREGAGRIAAVMAHEAKASKAVAELEALLHATAGVPLSASPVYAAALQ